MLKFFLLLFTVTALSMAKSIPAYYDAKAAPIKVVKSKLHKAGFKILSQYRASGHTVITVTNSELKRSNSFIAALNIAVNKNSLRFQNPNYFGLAYGVGSFPKTLSAINKVFGNLKPSPDQLDASKLPKYHFMIGMPYFDEQIVVAKGTPKKRVVYTLRLPNGSTLVGHKLSAQNRGFLSKIGVSNYACLLPYQSLIKGGTAKIMNPKYYIALSLPRLGMGQFMKISDIPDKIKTDIENDYK